MVHQLKHLTQILNPNPPYRHTLGLKYGREQACSAGKGRAGDGEMDDVVGMPGVPDQRHRGASDCTCDRAVLLQHQVNISSLLLCFCKVDGSLHSTKTAIRLGNGTHPVMASSGLPQAVR